MVTVTNAVVCIISLPLIASVTIFITMAVYSDYQLREEDQRDINLNQTLQDDLEIDDSDVNWGREGNISYVKDLTDEDVNNDSIDMNLQGEDHRPTTLRYFDEQVPIIATDLKEYFSSFKR